ncbi:MAG: phenylacetate--CoA ligase, partial [Thermoplasmata archaeon]
MTRYFEKKYETMGRGELEELQLKRLRSVVKWAYERVPFYRKKLDGAGVKPEDIKSLSDIEKIPFTTKDELRENMPFGLVAVPLEETVELHASSGTTGTPVTVVYTR